MIIVLNFSLRQQTGSFSNRFLRVWSVFPLIDSFANNTRYELCNFTIELPYWLESEWLRECELCAPAQRSVSASVSRSPALVVCASEIASAGRAPAARPISAFITCARCFRRLAPSQLASAHSLISLPRESDLQPLTFCFWHRTERSALGASVAPSVSSTC